MGDRINVRSVDSLEQLRTSLRRFADQVEQQLMQVEAQVRRTQEWLQEREQHWQRQVERARNDVQRARAAYTTCINTVYYDSEGRPVRPSCGAEAAAVSTAERQLQVCEAELGKVRAYRTQVEQAVSNYRMHAQHVMNLCRSRTASADAFLAQRIRELNKYLAITSAATSAALSNMGTPLNGGWVEVHSTINPIDLPDPVEIENEGFNKVPEDVMRQGLERLQEMRPLIESGVGANREYWEEYDRMHGFVSPNSYAQIWDVFYGTDEIRVERDGSNYTINSGRHRIYLARRMGIDWLPARITSRG